MIMLRVSTCLVTILLLYSTMIEGKIISKLIRDNSHWEELALFNISNLVVERKKEFLGKENAWVSTHT